MTALLAVIDGQAVPLVGCDWVLWMPCGCARAVTVASQRGHVVASDEQAWRQFYDRKRDAGKARKGGWRVELVTHERCKTVLDGWGKPCPHETPNP